MGGEVVFLWSVGRGPASMSQEVRERLLTG